MKTKKKKQKKTTKQPRNLGKIQQRRSLSQVFLKESWPCEEMAEILLSEGVSSVVEIGPGSGALTKVLLDKGISVFAVEKDERFATYLTEEVASSYVDGDVSLEVLHEDVLQFDLGGFLAKNKNVQAVVGNIPYSISTQIVSHILPELSHIKKSLLLVQLEFAERLASEAGRKSYGSLSVYTQLRSQVGFEFVVEKECFVPIPKVDSAVISFAHKKSAHSKELLEKVEKITRVAFSQRRKKLSNALKPFMTAMPDVELSVDLTRRPDTLTPEEFISLAKSFFPKL